MANRITYNMCGGSNFTNVPNIQGSAISRNMYSESNSVGDINDDTTKYFMSSCPGIKFLSSLGNNSNCDGMFVPSTGLANMDFEQCLFVAYKGSIHRIDSSLTMK